MCVCPSVRHKREEAVGVCLSVRPSVRLYEYNLR